MDLLDGEDDVAEQATSASSPDKDSEASRPPKYRPEDSIFVRLARAQEEVRVITQDVTVTMGVGSYKGVSAAQIVALGKRVLLDNGILFLPMPDKDSFKIESNLRMLWVEGRFCCIDKPEECFTSGAWGEGADKNDKGAAKAYTSANKQILAKVLEMTTIEDAEGDHENVPKDGTDGPTKGKATVQAVPMTHEESLTKANAIIKGMAKVLYPEDADAFANNYGAEIQRLQPKDADAVRAEFRKRLKRK